MKKQGIKFYKTPDAVLRAQLDAWDKIVAKKSAENPLFKKVLDSQRPSPSAPARGSTTTWSTSRWPYNHYFGRQEDLIPDAAQGQPSTTRMAGLFLTERHGPP